MQSVLSRFWTRVAESISYDDNHYTTGTSAEIQSLYSTVPTNWAIRNSQKSKSEKFSNLLARSHLQSVYHVTEAVEAMGDTRCYVWYRDCNYTDTFCIASLRTIDNKRVDGWGARGVMVIVVGNGHGGTSSNPGQDWLHFT